MNTGDASAFQRPTRTLWWSGAAFALLSGLVSLALGQDRNWDLRNYHLYNAYAWLGERWHVDLAPAQLQSYFTPLLDLPYFWLLRHGSAELAGFALGAWHGLGFALAAAVAWRLLDAEPRRMRTALLLALAGCTGAAFLSELGNTMGDNTTAPFVLGALLVLLPRDTPIGRGQLIGAGALLGLAVALKLTNAIYAVGLAAAVLVQPTGQPRWGQLTTLTVAALVVFALVAGPWHWTLWTTFGNPLFPQFNALFQAPLAQPIGVADHQWGPKGLAEWLVWPLVFTFDPMRVGTSPLPQVIWAVLFAFAAGLALRRLVRQPLPRQPLAADLRFVAVFLGASFLAWMAVFNIYRYLVVLELLAPLLLWLMLRPHWPRATPWLVAGCALVSLLGWNTWGHAGWSERDFAVDRPAAARDKAATVVFVGGEPVAWTVPFLPADWAFVSVATNFPESDAYRTRAADIVRSRGQPAFAVVPAHVDRSAERIARVDAQARRLGLDGCGALGRLAKHVRGNAAVVPVGGGRCRLHAPADAGLTAAENKAAAERAQELLRGYGLSMLAADCRVHDARIGADAHPLLWCPIALR
ncbi:hypothetical protein ACFFGH_06875 [Lysobacter korlensis]|uniref:DUF2029 domain-containing protein n=1 Tax=Lysobacter korlensis TaxID=553636 RepID=A0ABV6RKR5_9GAMM